MTRFLSAEPNGAAQDNCVLACVQRNKTKAERTPAEAGMKLRKQPCRPTWKPLYPGLFIGP